MSPAPRKKSLKLANREEKRSALTKQIADALLTAGVADIPLRDLAAQIGTSDRMLLYYFADKTDLVLSSLNVMSTELAGELDARLSARSSPAGLLTEASKLLASKDLSRLLAVWADVSARGSRGEQPFVTIARNSIQWWLEWLENRLDMPPTEQRRDAAIAVLAVIEGMRLLEAFVPDLTDGALVILSRALAAAHRR